MLPGRQRPDRPVDAAPLFDRCADRCPPLEVALTDDVLVVHGGTPLHGQIRVRGAKNLVSKAMVAALLGDDAEPAVRRARASATSRSSAACWSCTASGSPTAPSDGELVLDPTNVERASVDEINVHAGSSRIPILFCGPLLHRLGHAFIPDLGGCHIGAAPDRLPPRRRCASSARSSTRRPRACTSPRPNGLHGTKFELPYPSVGATEQVLLTAVLRRGRHRAAQRGRRAGDHRPDLRAAEDGRDHQGPHRPGDRDRGRAAARGYTHRPIPDRIEAASWARGRAGHPRRRRRCAAPGRPT